MQNRCGKAVMFFNVDPFWFDYEHVEAPLFIIDENTDGFLIGGVVVVVGYLAPESSTPAVAAMRAKARGNTAIDLFGSSTNM